MSLRDAYNSQNGASLSDVVAAVNSLSDTIEQLKGRITAIETAAKRADITSWHAGSKYTRHDDACNYVYLVKHVTEDGAAMLQYVNKGGYTQYSTEGKSRRHLYVWLEG